MENTESQSTESDDQEFSEFLSPISSEEFFEEVFEIERISQYRFAEEYPVQ